jgi:hypothetical protein
MKDTFSEKAQLYYDLNENGFYYIKKINMKRPFKISKKQFK